MGNQKRSQTNQGLYTKVHLTLLHSEAFRSLSPSAGKILPVFLLKGQYSTHKKITYFEFTHTEAENKFGMSRGTFSRAFKELIEKGFIDPVGVPGGLRGLNKTNNKYVLSGRWKHYDTSAFIRKTYQDFVQSSETSVNAKYGTGI